MSYLSPLNQTDNSESESEWVVTYITNDRCFQEAKKRQRLYLREIFIEISINEIKKSEEHNVEPKFQEDLMRFAKNEELW